MCSEAVGVLIAAVVQGTIINKYRTAGDCTDDGTTVSPSEKDDEVKCLIREITEITSFQGT